MNGVSNPVRQILAITRVNLVRAARDRQSLFFILVLPMILIIVLGFIMTWFFYFLLP